VREVAIPKEKYYQEKALSALQEALQNPNILSAKKQNHSRYLLADLHRRLGNHEAAKPLYEKVRNQGTDKRLTEMADFFLQQ
jgi:hypothetical protein